MEPPSSIVQVCACRLAIVEPLQLVVLRTGQTPHPENPLHTLVAEVMELVPELVEWGLDIRERLAAQPPSTVHNRACRVEQLKHEQLVVQQTGRKQRGRGLSD